MRFLAVISMLVSVVLTPPRSHARSVRQITHHATETHVTAAIDDIGNRIVMISSGDPLGTNPAHTLQLFAWDLASATTAQITSLPEGVGGRGEVGSSVSITDDGQTIAFLSTADPVGSNPDGSLEIFTIGFDGTGIAQVTSQPSPASGTIWSLSMSGSGSHIAFLARIDPLGSNPSLTMQLFRIETDGSNLEQLTSVLPSGATESQNRFSGYAISDDGANVGFAHNANLLGNNPTGNHKVYVFSANQLNDVGWGKHAVISGNGQWVAYEGSGSDLVTAKWNDLSTTSVVASGWTPAITDDGGRIYYETFAGLERWVTTIASNGSGSPVQIHPGSRPVVSGADKRIVAPRVGAVPAEGLLDGGYQWNAFRTNGDDLQPLTDTELIPRVWQPSVSSDGQRLAFLFGREDTALDAQRDFYAYSMRGDGSELTQLTPGPQAGKPVVNAAGTQVVLHSNSSDYVGPPGDGTHLYRVDVDGANLTQITPNGANDINYDHALSRDTDLIVFLSTGWVFGGDQGQLYSTPLGGGPFQQINVGSSEALSARVDAAGEWVVYHTRSNHDGLNPGSDWHVFRARTDGTFQERLTAGSWWAQSPDLSVDGQRIVYVSQLDPFGTNAEHNWELFLYDVAAGTTTQLTFTLEGDQLNPKLSEDGQWVYFLSSSPIFEPRTSNDYELYRMTIATGTIERIGGFFDPRGGLERRDSFSNYDFTLASDGDVFLTGSVNPTGENPDFSWEMWHVDFDRAPRFTIATESPTVVSWEADPRYVRYDLVRGDLQQLAVAGGGTTDLGDVICIGNDETRPFSGLSDAEQPDPGEGFFYLYRGSQGIWDGPGSYGQGATGERTATGGDCPI